MFICSSNSCSPILQYAGKLTVPNTDCMCLSVLQVCLHKCSQMFAPLTGRPRTAAVRLWLKGHSDPPLCQIHNKL